jgi:hypothetical protein
MKKLILIGMMVNMPSIWAQDITEAELKANFPDRFSEQTVDDLNGIHKGSGDQHDKSFDSGFYNVFISASAAAPADSADTYAYESAGCIYETGDAGAFFYVNLHLPDDHIIEGVRYYYHDESASNSTAILYLMAGDGTNTNLGEVSSTGDTGFGSLYEVLTDGDHVVDNSNGAYVIRFSSNEVGSNQRLCGVRLQMESNT